VAYVPSLDALKAWDIVELRQTGTYDTLLGFSRTGEGNAVLRVLCRKADPGYDACAEVLPRSGNYQSQGPLGTPYLKTLKEYGFSFNRSTRRMAVY
jgi:hypothetical protein